MTESLVGIKAIEYYLPETILDNEYLSSIYPDWTSEKIFKKTGIKSRHIASMDECASDLAIKAANRLFEDNNFSPKDIDFVIFASQSPDYLLPTTACIIQNTLGIPIKAGAIDINLGCSAFIYGLALGKSLVQTGIAKNVLLLTAETYSKYINPEDKSNRTIFGDGAAATIISFGGHNIGDFDLGTDGSGYDVLIVQNGGSRRNNNKSQEKTLFMDGPEVFNFTINVVPKSISRILEKHNKKLEDIDLFVFHQANKFMLEHLRKIIGIPEEKFYVNMQEVGNTVSATVPIALKMAEKEGRLKKGNSILLIGFGVGLSWGSTILTW